MKKTRSRSRGDRKSRSRGKKVNSKFRRHVRNGKLAVEEPTSKRESKCATSCLKGPLKFQSENLLVKHFRPDKIDSTVRSLEPCRDVPPPPPPLPLFPPVSHRISIFSKISWQYSLNTWDCAPLLMHDDSHANLVGFLRNSFVDPPPVLG